MSPMFKRVLTPSLLLLLQASHVNSAELEVRATDDASNRPLGGFVMKVWPAVLAAVLYAISGGLHWTHLFRVGRRFLLTLTIGMTCMTLGLLLKIAMSQSPHSLGLYILQQLFTLLSPCAFLATDYMLLSRLANSLGRDIADDCLLIPSRRITKLFVWSDVITFWIQAAGGGLSVQQSLSKMGTDIAMAGLILQLISFGLFALLLIVFGFRIRSRYPRAWNVRGKSESLFSVMGPLRTSTIYNWKLLYYTMCLTCIGILIRSSFRIAEFAAGYNGFLSTHEGYFYLLDALPLWVAMTLYVFLWPARFNNGEDEDSARGQSFAVPLTENGVKYTDRR